MSVPSPPCPQAFRQALDASLEGPGRPPLRPDADGAFAGEAFFGAALAGPPGRLHGGLHAYARVMSVLRALRGTDGLAAAFPLSCELRIERPLMLETPTPFTGTYQADASGFRLTTRFTDSPKLDARAASTAPLTDADVAPFREVLARCATEPSRTLMIRDSFPVTAHASGCVMTLDDAFFARPGNELLAALPLDGSIDAAFACIALDWMGAIGMGVLWQARLYTTHLRLRLNADVLPRDQPLVVVADCTRPEVDPEQTLDPIVLRGEEVRATSLPVALMAADGSRAYATGRVTLVPWAGQTERLGGPPPK